MEQWLWLAMMAFFHFDTERRGGRSKESICMNLVWFSQNFFSFVEIFQRKFVFIDQTYFLFSVSFGQLFISKKYLLLLSFLRSRFSSSSSALSSENPCSRSSRLCSMLEMYNRKNGTSTKIQYFVNDTCKHISVK